MLKKILGIGLLVIGLFLVIGNLPSQNLGSPDYFGQEICFYTKNHATNQCSQYCEDSMGNPTEKLVDNYFCYWESIVELVPLYSQVCTQDSECSDGKTCDKSTGKCITVYYDLGVTPVEPYVQTMANDFWEATVGKTLSDTCFDGVEVGQCNNVGFFCTSAGYVASAKDCGCPDGYEAGPHDVCISSEDENNDPVKNKQSSFQIFMIGIIMLIIGGVLLWF